MFFHEVCSVPECVLYDFGGLDLFCLSFSVLSMCLPRMFSNVVCNVAEGVVYLVPGPSFRTEAFPPQLLSTYSYINQRV